MRKRSSLFIAPRWLEGDAQPSTEGDKLRFLPSVLSADASRLKYELLSSKRGGLVRWRRNLGQFLTVTQFGNAPSDG